MEPSQRSLRHKAVLLVVALVLGTLPAAPSALGGGKVMSDIENWPDRVNAVLFILAFHIFWDGEDQEVSVTGVCHRGV